MTLFLAIDWTFVCCTSLACPYLPPPDLRDLFFPALLLPSVILQSNSVACFRLLSVLNCHRPTLHHHLIVSIAPIPSSGVYESKTLVFLGGGLLIRPWLVSRGAGPPPTGVTTSIWLLRSGPQWAALGCGEEFIPWEWLQSWSGWTAQPVLCVRSTAILTNLFLAQVVCHRTSWLKSCSQDQGNIPAWLRAPSLHRLGRCKAQLVP